MAVEAGDAGEDAVGSLDPSRDGDQLRAIAAVAARHLLRDVVAAAIGQSDVDQADVGPDRMEEAPEVFRRSRAFGDVALGAQQLDERAQGIGLVFHDDDAQCARRRLDG